MSARGLVYSATHQINPKNGKALRIRREERQVTLRKWKERLCGSSKGEWTCLLIHNLEAWLERGHRQRNFYLTQVMSGHGAFNAYLFPMKLVESPKCTICDRRRWDDAWHTLFEYRAFQLYWEDVMTILQKEDEQLLTPDSYRAEGWDQLAAFAALTVRRKKPPPYNTQCQTLPSLCVCH